MKARTRLGFPKVGGGGGGRTHDKIRFAAECGYRVKHSNYHFIGVQLALRISTLTLARGKQGFAATGPTHMGKITPDLNQPNVCDLKSVRHD